MHGAQVQAVQRWLLMVQGTLLLISHLHLVWFNFTLHIWKPTKLLGTSRGCKSCSFWVALPKINIDQKDKSRRKKTTQPLNPSPFIWFVHHKKQTMALCPCMTSAHAHCPHLPARHSLPVLIRFFRLTFNALSLFSLNNPSAFTLWPNCPSV